MSNANKYWSSTTLPNQTTKAWYLNTQFGITTYDAKTIKHYIICVKGNQLTTGNGVIRSTNLEVYPNPFASVINIRNNTGNEYYELVNSIGEVIYCGKNIDQQEFIVLAKGIYF